MIKKALVILLICALFLTMGCARKNDGGTPQVTPTITPATTVSPKPSATPAVTPSPGAGWTYFDPSLVDVSGEGNDSLPDMILPTPESFNP